MGCGSSTSVESVKRKPEKTVKFVDDVSGDDESDWSETEYDGEETNSILPDSGYDEVTIPDEDPREFLPSIGFPTHLTLLEDQQEYTKMRKPGDMDENGSLLPYPCPSLKRDLCDVEKFSKIDTHAVEIPESYLHKPIEDVVTYLESVCNSELEKVRAFFRFVTAIAHRESADVEASENTAYWFIKHETNYYCSLFGKLCECANIPWKTIQCYVKTKDDIGKGIAEAKLGSCSVVLIDKEWRLLDVHWAATHISGGSSGDWELIDDNGRGAKPVEQTPKERQYAYVEYYFLTDPHELIYNHLPKDDQWQLLARPVTLPEFQEMVLLSPAFFKLDLRVTSHPKCVLTAPNGTTQIKIGLPKGKAREFMYKLWLSTKGKDKSNHGNFKLERFAFMQVNDNTLEISLEFPVAGQFKFQLFGQNAEDDAENNKYAHACTYIIDCLKPKEDCKALPENTGAQWGPGPKLQKAGLVPLTHTEGIIETENGFAEIRFQKTKDIDIIHNLKGNDDGKIENLVIHWHEGDEVVVMMKVPDEGNYALNLFAKESGNEGPYSNVCSYLVSSDQGAVDPDSFPAIANGRLGHTDEGKTIGLHPKSHPVPYITAIEDGKLIIVFTMDQPLDFTTSLEHKKNKLENCCFTTKSDKEVSFEISFPDTGLYGFTIFAKLHGKEGSYPAAFHYVIDAKAPNSLHQPFPKTYGKWGAGCILYDPKSLQLLENTTVPFKLKVPNAQDVAAIVNKEWTHLEQTDDGYWVGDVDTKEAGNVLAICVKADPGSNSYSNVLEYQVVKDEVRQRYAQELERKQNEAKGKIERDQYEKNRMEEELVAVRKALLESMEGRNIATLKTAIKDVHDKRFTTRLKQELSQAKQWLASLERIKRLGRAIEKMDKALMQEIRNYKEPPAAVHEVMVACFLLLGENEGRTRIWKECQKLCVTIGKNGFFRKVRGLDIRAMHPEISARGYRILSKLRWDEVVDASAGAATIYNWALGVIEEHRAQNKDVKTAQPANLKQQKEIFNAMKQKKK